jgi:hypothetical protein
MMEDRRLKYAFIWPGSENYEATPRFAKNYTGQINKAKIDLRIYDQSKEIYIGPFRNQRTINLKKENMDGDFLDLQINLYIVVSNNHCENKIKFWIAKVESIISQEKN